jgi:AcrR family transcriptional regulator
VDAILDATIQVLLSVGTERLTTTRVAMRAGVAVGSLYQYFPNKSALIQAVLQRHLEGVTAVVERVCREQQGQTLAQMAAALTTAFINAKMRDVKSSVALYAVSPRVDAAKIAQEMGVRSNKAIAEMLMTAREPLATDPELIASMVQGAMTGVMRRLLECGDPEKQLDGVREELPRLVNGYLAACSVRPAAVTLMV